MMGMCLDSTPEMGEYSVEVRRESFYLRGEYAPQHRARHAIEVYPEPGNPTQGSIELLIEDIPKIRAALDLVEKYRQTK